MPEQTLHAWHRAFADVTDYQLRRATDHLLRHWAGEFPPTGAEVLRRAQKYLATERAEAARIEHNQRQLEIAAQPRIGNG